MKIEAEASFSTFIDFFLCLVTLVDCPIGYDNYVPCIRLAIFSKCVAAFSTTHKLSRLSIDGRLLQEP